jgi:hypothetical protein
MFTPPTWEERKCTAIRGKMVVPQYILLKRTELIQVSLLLKTYSFRSLILDSLPELDSNPNIPSCLMMSELPSAIISAFDFTLSGYLPFEV